MLKIENFEEVSIFVALLQQGSGNQNKEVAAGKKGFMYYHLS